MHDHYFLKTADYLILDHAGNITDRTGTPSLPPLGGTGFRALRVLRSETLIETEIKNFLSLQMNSQSFSETSYLVHTGLMSLRT